MKRIRRLLLLTGLISIFTGKEAYAQNSLQAKIDKIPENGRLFLKKGIYQERIVLQKSIFLEGEKGTVFKECSSKPVITIKGENVRVKGIKIESCKKKSGEPVIYITGRNHQMEDVSIDSPGVAVKLDNAEKTKISNMKVTGMEQERGFDLWNSHFNTFTRVRIDHVQDGFYMENSHFNSFIGNKISDSRYGLHVMFSDNITIKNNSSFRNFTGAMVMGTNNSIIQNNRFTDNNQNVNAQGLLMYDVHQSSVRDNLIANNRVGLYMEDSSNNDIENNKMKNNFIGAQMNKIKNNKVHHNSFISNVNELQAIKSTGNLIQNNYWDAAWKLDTNGDGKSNIPYRADPYFLNLIEEIPEYQLFFQDPGMLVLQKMLKSPEKKLITDESPLMKSGINTNQHPGSNKSKVWILSLVMISGSLIMIIKGRKKL